MPERDSCNIVWQHISNCLSQPTVIHSAGVGAYVCVCGWVGAMCVCVGVAIGIYALEIFDYWNVEVVLILKEATPD